MTSVLTLDFTGESSFAPATIDVTIQNLGSAVGRALVFYDMDQPGTAHFQESATSTSRLLPGVPPDRQASGDLHAVRVVATDANGARDALVYLHEARPVTIPLGPPLIPPTAFLAAQEPTLRPGVRVPAQPEYGHRWSSLWFHTDSQAPIVEVRASADYLKGDPIELAVPDFSGLPDWDPTWGFPSDGDLLYVVLAEGWSQGSPATPSDGLTRQVASLSAPF